MLTCVDRFISGYYSGVQKIEPECLVSRMALFVGRRFPEEARHRREPILVGWTSPQTSAGLALDARGSLFRSLNTPSLDRGCFFRGHENCRQSTDKSRAKVGHSLKPSCPTPAPR